MWRMIRWNRLLYHLGAYRMEYNACDSNGNKWNGYKGHVDSTHKHYHTPLCNKNQIIFVKYFTWLAYLLEL